MHHKKRAAAQYEAVPARERAGTGDYFYALGASASKALSGGLTGLGHEDEGSFFDEIAITQHVKVGARALIPELLLTGMLLGFGVGVNDMRVRGISFIEGDSALSHPLLPEVVPAGRLFEFSLGWPSLILACVTIVSRGWNKPALRTLGWLELGLLQAFGLALATSCALKIVTARHRPNFFASCNYKGFRDAQESGDFSGYLSRITPGSLGSLEHCWDKPSPGQHESIRARQAMQGFPSSHSALCFAAFGFLAAATRALFALRGGQWFSWRSSIACSPLVLAAWVCVTRIRDRYHTEGDVATGASLGLLCASLAWSHFTAFPGRNELSLRVGALPSTTELEGGPADWVGEEVPQEEPAGRSGQEGERDSAGKTGGMSAGQNASEHGHAQ